MMYYYMYYFDTSVATEDSRHLVSNNGLMCTRICGCIIASGLSASGAALMTVVSESKIAGKDVADALGWGGGSSASEKPSS